MDKDVLTGNRSLAVAVVVTATLVAFAGFTALDARDSGAGNVSDWRQVELRDVNSGERYTVAELEKPVLVESFAVWCTVCTRQQKEIQELHRDTDVRSVSIDTDPNEDEAKIRQHLDRHGFGWRYSVAPPGMIRSLTEEFGREVVVAPRAPVILVCEDGSRLLPSGVKPVSRLKQEIQKGC